MHVIGFSSRNRDEMCPAPLLPFSMYSPTSTGNVRIAQRVQHAPTRESSSPNSGSIGLVGGSSAPELEPKDIRHGWSVSTISNSQTVHCGFPLTKWRCTAMDRRLLERRPSDAGGTAGHSSQISVRLFRPTPKFWPGRRGVVVERRRPRDLRVQGLPPCSLRPWVAILLDCDCTTNDSVL